MAAGSVEVLVCFTVNLEGSREHRDRFEHDLFNWERDNNIRSVLEGEYKMDQWQAGYKKEDAGAVINFLTSLNIPIAWTQR